MLMLPLKGACRFEQMLLSYHVWTPVLSIVKDGALECHIIFDMSISVAAIVCVLLPSLLSI